MLKELKETMLKELNESMITMSHQKENINKEIKLLKQQHIETGVEKYNNQNENFTRRLNRIFKLAAKLKIQIYQYSFANQKYRAKKRKRNEWSLRKCETIKCTKIHIKELEKKEERKKH